MTKEKRREGFSSLSRFCLLYQEIGAHIAGAAVFKLHQAPVHAFFQYSHLGAHFQRIQHLGFHAGIKPEVHNAAAVNILQLGSIGFFHRLCVLGCLGSSEIAAVHVAGVFAHLHLIPSIAFFQHRHRRINGIGGDNFAAHGGALAQVQANAGIGTHIHGAAGLEK